MSTIAAISTPKGIGGIGVVRISGAEAIEIADRVFKPFDGVSRLSSMKGYTAKYGKVMSNHQLIDDAVALVFKAPHSYTGENVVEISCHGGLYLTREVLRAVLKAGASAAEPGEFTKRAYLNGRIDLTQAEAVIDVINSKTDKEARASMNQLEGVLSEKISEIRRDLISGMADIEVTIDYPEYDVEEMTNSQILELLKRNKVRLEKLERSFTNGKILRDGVKTAIIGRPNAGKSSLLNLLLNEERAIVTEIEGTTRDTIEEFISLDGIPFKIIDTAGIRDTEDTVERIGVQKAIEIAKKSDLVIAIFDISKRITDEDRKILDILSDKNAIIVLNKTDIMSACPDEVIFKEINKKIIKISAKTQDGVDELLSNMVKMVSNEDIKADGELLVINVRHKGLIAKAKDALQKAIDTINSGMPIDVIAIYMKDILEELGKITGESVTDDIISEIFSKFCLGK